MTASNCSGTFLPFPSSFCILDFTTFFNRWEVKHNCLLGNKSDDKGWVGDFISDGAGGGGVLGELGGFDDDDDVWVGTLGTLAAVGKKKLLLLLFFSSSDTFLFASLTFLPWLNQHSRWCTFLYDDPLLHQIYLNNGWFEDDCVEVDDVAIFDGIGDGVFIYDGIDDGVFLQNRFIWGVFFIIWDGLCVDDSDVRFFFSIVGVFICQEGWWPILFCVSTIQFH